METFDITIIGAGPVGLYAGFFAGMRGLSVHILEVSEEVGGQPQQIYPEKAIYDIAGLPKISGKELSDNLLKQLARVAHTLTLGQKVEKIEKQADGKFLILTDQAEYQSQSVLITTGNGLITPRKIGVQGEDDLHAKGKLAYFVKNLEDYKGQSVAVLGGGDSALDWALMLEKMAAKVSVVHRRLAFRAHELTVEEVKASSIELYTPYTVESVSDSGLRLAKVKSDETLALAVDKILVTYGFVTSVIDIMEDLAVNRNNRILVDQDMCSSVAGVYAAGDVATYRESEAKIPLIAVGFGEAVTAISAIAKTIDFGHKLVNGHSSTVFAG